MVRVIAFIIYKTLNKLIEGKIWYMCFIDQFLFPLFLVCIVWPVWASFVRYYVREFLSTPTFYKEPQFNYTKNC